MNNIVLVYFLLIAARLLAIETSPAFTYHSSEKTNVTPVYQIYKNPDTELAFKENDPELSKHCENVVTSGIPVPATHQLKNKSSFRFSNLFIIYLERESSQLNINGNLISAIRNISPLSDILLI